MCLQGGFLSPGIDIRVNDPVSASNNHSNRLIKYRKAKYNV